MKPKLRKIVRFSNVLFPFCVFFCFIRERTLRLYAVYFAFNIGCDIAGGSKMALGLLLQNDYNLLKVSTAHMQRETTECYSNISK